MVNLQRRLLTTMIALSVGVPVVAGAAPARGQETVFVMSNNTERNQVIAFERRDDGSYFEQNRFDTLGRGSGGVNDPLESQGSLTLSPDHTLLFAANAGSGDITVFQRSYQTETYAGSVLPDVFLTSMNPVHAETFFAGIARELAKG